jgi:hypothetical protein
MKNIRKILIIEIIFLLLFISISSSASDINIEKEKIINQKPEKLDNQVELFTYIQGLCFHVDKTGFIFNKPIEITAYKMSINIIGFKIPTENFYDIFFTVGLISHLKAYRFFGIVEGSYPPSVKGFAIGDIEWD